jgi:hypothetical protein
LRLVSPIGGDTDGSGNLSTKVCLNSKFPPTLHSTLERQPATLFGENCVRFYLLGYLSISVFTTENFRIKEKNENLFLNAASKYVENQILKAK